MGFKIHVSRAKESGREKETLFHRATNRYRCRVLNATVASAGPRRLV